MRLIKSAEVITKISDYEVHIVLSVRLSSVTTFNVMICLLNLFINENDLTMTRKLENFVKNCVVTSIFQQF